MCWDFGVAFVVVTVIVWNVNRCGVDFRLRENIFLLKTCPKIRSDDKDVIMAMAMNNRKTWG